MKTILSLASLLAILVAVAGCSHSSPTEPVALEKMTLDTALGSFQINAADCPPDLSQLHGGIDGAAHSGPITAQSCIQIASQQCHLPPSTFINAMQGYTITLASGGSWILGTQIQVNCAQQQAGVRHEVCEGMRRAFPCISNPDNW